MELNLIGLLLNQRYIIEKQLGKGSYAEIYVARDRYASPESPYFRVVIKALNTTLQGEIDEALERTLVENFETEAKVLDLVRHPNVVSRLGHGTARDRNGRIFHYLILEYLPGGDLSKLCRPNGLPLDKVIYYLEQVCAGLMKAHEKGVIHRDIKPQNLLLTQDQKTVKITDFGVARFAEIVAPITRVGTNLYAPPEHSPINSHVESTYKLTPAADIYSLAKTAYVLLTGKAPHEFLGKPITRLPEGFDDPMHQKFLRVLERATQDEPSRRHQSIREFWSDVASLDEAETKLAITQVLTIPSGRISEGYIDIPPETPDFRTSPDIHLTQIAQEQQNDKPIEIHLSSIESYVESEEKPSKKNTKLRQFIKVSALLVIFAIALSATQIYLRRNILIPRVETSWDDKIGIATTDLNIRQNPGPREPIVGLLPKGSKVKIIRSQDNWYEVNVIEYSRPKRNDKDADRGWINGRYVDLSTN